MTETEFQEFVIKHTDKMHTTFCCPLGVTCIIGKKLVAYYNPFPELAANTLNLNLSYASGVARGFDAKPIQIPDGDSDYFSFEPDEYKRGYEFGQQCRQICLNRESEWNYRGLEA